MKEKIGDYLLDTSKLVFAGVVLSTVLELEVSKPTIIFIGIYSSSMIAFLGFIILQK